MTGGRIHVRYTKWDGSLHWHFDTEHLADDVHGRWLLASPGVEYRRGSEPVRVDEDGFVLLIPDNGWWTAYFNAVPRSKEPHLVYVDVNTVAQWEGDTVHLVDLDLDVTMRPDHSVALLDEDEFMEHKERYGYPSEIVQGARHAADWLLDAMRSAAEPFAVAGPARVAAALGWAQGTVVAGHGAASGDKGDPRFPAGTLAEQAALFAAHGVYIGRFHRGTINLDVSPLRLEPVESLATIRDLPWTEHSPPETFSFFEATLSRDGSSHPALIYRPHPETKPEHQQPERVVEVLAPFIEGIEPGVAASLHIPPDQGVFVAAK